MFVFTPYTSSTGNDWFRGTADSIYQNMTYLHRSNEEYVIIASGDSVYKMDYRDVLQYHIDKGADITVVYQNMEGKDLTHFGIMQMDENKRLLGFEEKPEQAQTTSASLGIYVISRKLLISLLQEVVPQGGYGLVKDIIIPYNMKLNIFGYEFKGYWRRGS